MATRWGIVGAGLISGDFVRAVQQLPTSDHQVVVIAARNIDRAGEFAKKFNIPKAVGSYQELAKDEDVDVVYVGTIHPYHADVTKLMLEAGKAVLCEKPLCMNVRQTREVLQLAKNKGLFLMEALWSRCFPAYEKIRNVLTDGSIGEPQMVQAEFGFVCGDVARMTDLNLGAGGILDIGIYPIQLADMVFGGKPEKIVASATVQKSGADDTSVVVLTYSGGRVATLTSSLSCNLKNQAIIYCTNGVIEIPRTMWSPTSLIINGEEILFPLPGDSPDFNFENSSGLAHEAQHVRECLLKGALESPLATHNTTLNIAEIMEEALRQVGIEYKC